MQNNLTLTQISTNSSFNNNNYILFLRHFTILKDVIVKIFGMVLLQQNPKLLLNELFK